MFDTIKKTVTKLILHCLDIDVLVRRIERESLYKAKQVCIMGEGSVLYYPAKMINYASKEKIRIGKNSHINGELMIWPYSKGIIVGDNSYVGINSFIRSEEYISIGDNVLIAHNVNIIDTDSHEIDCGKRARGFLNQINNGFLEQKGEVKTSPIIIEDYVWISYNVSILKGVTIGKGAIVAAGSVVTKDVEPFTLVAGNPAKFVKKLDSNEFEEN